MKRRIIWKLFPFITRIIFMTLLLNKKRTNSTKISRMLYFSHFFPFLWMTIFFHFDFWLWLFWMKIQVLNANDFCQTFFIFKQRFFFFIVSVVFLGPVAPVILIYLISNKLLSSFFKLRARCSKVIGWYIKNPVFIELWKN